MARGSINSASELEMADYIKKTLAYDPETGMFRRIFRNSSSTAKIGEWFCGTMTSCGHLRIGTKRGSSFFAHRIAWLLHHGEWPHLFIDHINGDPRDNRIENLRLSSSSENQRNKGPNRNNKSGVKGVSLNCGKWRATISVNRKKIHLGAFHDIASAQKARETAEAYYFGQFSYWNRPDAMFTKDTPHD